MNGRKKNWDEVFEALDKAGMPDDFLSDKDRDRSVPKDFDILSSEDSAQSLPKQPEKDQQKK